MNERGKTTQRLNMLGQEWSVARRLTAVEVMQVSKFECNIVFETSLNNSNQGN